MKKTMSIIAVFVVLLFTVSANTGRGSDIAEGMKAPHFTVKAKDGKDISPSDMDGRFVIVNFWASDDAGSRMAANLYDSYVGNGREEQVCLVSVNFDDNERLFREIVRLDGLDEKSQFNVRPTEMSALINSYGMAGGLKSFLLTPDGTVAAVNPTIETIARIAG